jgi:hypothetical protein
MKPEKDCQENPEERYLGGAREDEMQELSEESVQLKLSRYWKKSGRSAGEAALRPVPMSLLQSTFGARACPPWFSDLLELTPAAARCLDSVLIDELHFSRYGYALEVLGNGKDRLTTRSLYWGVTKYSADMRDPQALAIFTPIQKREVLKRFRANRMKESSYPSYPLVSRLNARLVRDFLAPAGVSIGDELGGSNVFLDMWFNCKAQCSPS